MADETRPTDPAPLRVRCIKRLICFTPAADGYVNYLVKAERANGDAKANRSSEIRKALRARQVLRHDLTGELHSLKLMRDMLLQGVDLPREEIISYLDGIILGLDRKLNDPSDPQPHPHQRVMADS